MRNIGKSPVMISTFQLDAELGNPLGLSILPLEPYPGTVGHAIDLRKARRVIDRLIRELDSNQPKPDPSNPNPSKPGRPTVKFSAQEIDPIMKQYRARKISTNHIARILKIGRATAQRLVRNPEKFKR